MVREPVVKEEGKKLGGKKLLAEVDDEGKKVVLGRVGRIA